MSEHNGSSELFNPGDHIRMIPRKEKQADGTWVEKHNPYLDVQWRVHWFRQEHPEGQIVTELLTAPAEVPAAFKATIRLENGLVTTGYGHDTDKDWAIEKAETRAVGRALALAGYGTQFISDIDQIIADAPVDAHIDRGATNQGAANQRPRNPDVPRSDRQMAYIESLSKELGLEEPDVQLIIGEMFPERTTQLLTKGQATDLIGRLQKMQAGSDKTPDSTVPEASGSGLPPVSEDSPLRNLTEDEQAEIGFKLDEADITATDLYAFVKKRMRKTINDEAWPGTITGILQKMTAGQADVVLEAVERGTLIESAS